MNCVVTGASSFLGAALTGRLLEEGHTVYAVVRPGSASRKPLQAAASRAAVPGLLHVLELELEELDQIHKKINPMCQYFFHFGWEGSGSANRKLPEVQQKNVRDSLRALEGARRLGCRLFLFSGSQAEYGICHTLMTENSPCLAVSEYGKAKLEFYKQAVARVRQWKQEMAYVHARIFSVYGPGDHPWSLVNTCLEKFQRGETMELGACRQQWNFLYIDDLVNALSALAFCEEPTGFNEAAGESGIYNVAGEARDTRPLSDYVEEIHRLCGGRGTCHYGKLPPNAEGEANLIPDIGKIKRTTGWKPEITFKEGIRRMIRPHCIACGEPLNGTPLMELKGMPASAQDIPSAEELKQDEGITLHLHQCRQCGLVQFDCEPVAYYRDVIRSGGYSTTMKELRTSQYRHLIETYHLHGKKFLEAGCGRGEFLSMLTEFPVAAYGVEHRQQLVDLAKADGLKVTQGFPETEETLLGHHGPYDVFLSFNFLEHQPQPGVMLDCISRNLTDGGLGLITVPSLEYILNYNGYYELIRDHLAYYTFDSLERLLNRHSFEVLEKEIVNRDTLSVIVRKREGQILPKQDRISPKTMAASGLISSFSHIRNQMENLTAELEKKGERLAIWGASHQGFTLAATTCLGKKAVYIIDSAPFKQGKFAPASHLPIKAPEYFFKNPVEAVLIVAPGYTTEIMGIIRNRFGAEVRILALRSEELEELS